jgi:hypothetical protein
MGDQQRQELWGWLSIQLGISSSQLTNSIIFQRGRSTTNQLATILGPHSQNLGDALFWDGSREVELNTEVRLNEPRANHHSGIGPNPRDAKITIVDGSIIPPFQMVKSQPKMADVEMKWELSAN